MEDQKEEANAYDQDYSQQYDEVMRCNNLIDYNASHFHYFAHLFKGATVLELGCGSGTFLEEALKHGASKIVGIDVSDETLTISKAKFEKLGANLYIRQGDCFKDRVVHEDGPFDYVTANYVTCYVPTMDQLEILCCNLYDNLKEGGVCAFLIVPIEGDWYAEPRKRSANPISSPGAIDGQPLKCFSLVH